MQYELTAPTHLHARIDLPSSKSISNRALIINALAGGKADLNNLSDCDDTRVTMQALRNTPDIIDIQAAGTAMRFLSAYLAVTPGCHIITGTERMKHRPIGILTNALRTLGAQVEYIGEEGFPPLQITGGRHKGGELTLPGNVSSQYISALLMIGPALEKGLRIHLTGHTVSAPYIDMTLKIMRDFGAKADWISDTDIQVQPHPYRPRPYTIESDWSAASYWYEMVALSPCPDTIVELTGLNADSCQGDSAVQQYFMTLGVRTVFEDNQVRLYKTKTEHHAVCLDLSDQPDLAQTMAVTCALSERPFHFTGLQSLRIKETDRMAALRRELLKLGYVIEEANESELMWKGQCCRPDPEPAIDTYEDHRMALSFAPVCFRFPHLRINDTHVVTKSYPGYWNDLLKAGFNLQPHS